MRLLRFTAGLVPGILFWLLISPPLTQLLAVATRPLIGLDSRFHNFELTAHGTSVTMEAPGEFIPSASFPVDQLTYPMILLIALFTSNAQPWRLRNMAAAMGSLAFFIMLQPLAVLITVESSYAVFAGRWGEEHYGKVAANVWLFLQMFWRLIGMFAVVFACWWLARTSERFGEKRVGTESDR